LFVIPEWFVIPSFFVIPEGNLLFHPPHHLAQDRVPHIWRHHRQMWDERPSLPSIARRKALCTPEFHMPETYLLSARLLPELEQELAKTRRVLEAVPDGHNDFKPHEKSMLLNRLAGHTAEFAGFAALSLTLPGIDMQTPADPRKILRMETKAKLLADFDELAAGAIAALKNTTDAAFDETFTLSRKGQPVFTGTRYTAYRNNVLNHMVHHRGQLTVYLRLLDQPVPGTFGPSADGL